MPAPLRALIKAIGERLSGSRPSLLRALAVAVMVGVTTSVLTYRFLRSGG